MHYQYRIFCPVQDRPVRDSLKDLPQLFDAYSCVLLDSIRRFNARAAAPAVATPGMVLSFDADTPWQDVEGRLSQITAKWNARRHGPELVALRNQAEQFQQQV